MPHAHALLKGNFARNVVRFCKLRHGAQHDLRTAGKNFIGVHILN